MAKVYVVSAYTDGNLHEAGLAIFTSKRRAVLAAQATQKGLGENHNNVLVKCNIVDLADPDDGEGTCFYRNCKE